MHTFAASLLSPFCHLKKALFKGGYQWYNRDNLEAVQIGGGLFMAITSEYYQPSSDGITLLHVNQWTPVSPPVRRVVLIVHGVSG